jgi:hypothetical protein
MFHKENSFYIIIIAYSLFFLYFIGYENSYQKSILYELLTALILYASYYSYHKYYKKFKQSYFFVIWMDGTFLQLILNTITIFIYSIQFVNFSVDSNFGDKYVFIIRAVNYLLKNNLLILVFSQFILIFSFAEMTILFKKYKETGTHVVFSSGKYYLVLWIMILVKLIIGICFVGLNQSGGGNTNENNRDSYDSVMIMYNYVMYSVLSSVISSIFSFVLYHLVINSYYQKQYEGHTDEFRFSTIDFCRLQNYCIFIIDWKHLVTSYYLFFLAYTALIGIQGYLNITDELSLPHYSAYAHLIDIDKQHNL